MGFKKFKAKKIPEHKFLQGICRTHFDVWSVQLLSN